MATKPSPRPDSGTPSPANAAEDLALLERARTVVDVDQILDFGPWWYAPALATMIGGLTLFGQDTSHPGNIASGLVAVASAVAIAVHDHRRRRVRLRPSRRGVALLALITVLSWVLIGAWGTAVSSIGFDQFVPLYALVAWVLTTMVLLGIRAGFSALRLRRPPLR